MTRPKINAWWLWSATDMTLEWKSLHGLKIPSSSRQLWTPFVVALTMQRGNHTLTRSRVSGITSPGSVKLWSDESKFEFWRSGCSRIRSEQEVEQMIWLPLISWGMLQFVLFSFWFYPNKSNKIFFLSLVTIFSLREGDGVSWWNYDVLIKGREPGY